MSKEKRAKIAQETVVVLDQGHYVTESGKKIDIAESLRTSVENTRLYSTDEKKILNRIHRIAPISRLM